MLNFFEHVTGNHANCINVDGTPHICTTRSSTAEFRAAVSEFKKEFIGLLGDTSCYSRGRFSSQLEAFHSYLLIYCPKRLNFSVTYDTRIKMAAMAWNELKDQKKGLVEQGGKKALQQWQRQVMSVLFGDETVTRVFG